jgi:pyrimidine operon attenuation protein/uracil phosphoribosyltransferase
MHKQFPIKPDYVGLTIATTLQNNIVVEIEGIEIVGAFIQ